MTTLLPFLILLLVAVLVVVVASRWRIPYTIALVLLGLGVGLLSERISLPGIGEGVRSLLSPSVFFDLLLPPIVFEAALQVNFRQLRARAPLVLFLVFVGVVFTTLFTGLLVGALTAIPLAAALLLAAILSPTDPIAVIDLFRRLKVPEELSTIVEGESILHDAVGVILFLVLLGLVEGNAATPGSVAAQFLWLTFGGVAIGLLAAAGVYLVQPLLRDPSAATGLTVVAAFGTFLVSTDLGVSGIIATAIAGIAVGTWVVPRTKLPEVRTAIFSFWSVAVYVANSVVFLAMGLLFGLSGLVDYLGLILLVFAILTAGRILFVYAHRPLARALGGTGTELPSPWYRVIVLAGVRGAIPAVLALSLYSTATTLTDPTVRTIVSTVLGVVLVSIVLNNVLAEWYVDRTFEGRAASMDPGAPEGPGPRPG